MRSTLGWMNWKRAIKTLRLTLLIPALILFVFLVAVAFADWIAPHSPVETSLDIRMRPPFWFEGGTWQYPLGTDLVGRDIFSRIIHGARIAFLLPLVSLFVSAAIGAALGVAAAYYRGWIGAFIMRAADVTLAYPIVFFAVLLAVARGPKFTNVVIAIIIIMWARYARVIHGVALGLMERDFVAQARVGGCSALRIMSRHLFPNITDTLMVLTAMQVGWVIIVEASLSFLGAGIPRPTPAWGSMVADGRQYIISAWWLSFFPGLAITLVVLSFNLLGDWLRDTLDPKLRQV